MACLSLKVLSLTIFFAPSTILGWSFGSANDDEFGDFGEADFSKIEKYIVSKNNRQVLPTLRFGMCLVQLPNRTNILLGGAPWCDER